METLNTAVTGIGPSAAAVLTKHGFDSAEALANSLIKALVKVPGFGPVRAATIQKAALTMAETNSRDVGMEASSKKPKKDKKAEVAVQRGFQVTPISG